MATLQAAVSAVAGVTWVAATPVVAALGYAWSDTAGLHVVTGIVDRAGVLSEALVTTALDAVPTYSGTAPTSDVWSFAGRQVTVSTWVPAPAVDGGSTVVQVRAQTAAAWAAEDPVLALGESALETDTGVEKIGDGATAYTSLPSRQSGTYGPIVGSAAWLKMHSADPENLFVGVITRGTGGAPTSAPVVWPDGTTGTFAGTPSTSALAMGALDSYTLTYVGAAVTKTITQPAVTRNANTGEVTTRPERTVA